MQVNVVVEMTASSRESVVKSWGFVFQFPCSDAPS